MHLKPLLYSSRIDVNKFNIHEGLCGEVLKELDVDEEVCEKAKDRRQNKREADNNSALGREPAVEAVQPIPLARIRQSENLVPKANILLCDFLGQEVVVEGVRIICVIVHFRHTG